MSALNRYPKSAFGINNQQWVHNEDELLGLINQSNGKCSVFVSHNSYPDLDEQSHDHDNDDCPPIWSINNVSVDMFYIDMDDPRKLSHALGDCRKAILRAEEERWRWWAAFSGRKGFQFMVQLEPETIDINQKVHVDGGTFIQWSQFYRAIHTWFAHSCDNCGKTHPPGVGLRTVDFMCAEPKHIMRVWNTEHFKRGSKEGTGTYCIPLTIDQIMTLSPEEIVRLAKNPVREYDDYWNRAPDKRNLTVNQFIAEYQINPKDLAPSGAYASKMISDYKPNTHPSWAQMQMLWPNHPCLVTEMFNNMEPRHMARFASLAILKKRSDDPRINFEIDEDWVVQFYENRHYIDYDETITRRQARSILNRGELSFTGKPVYEPPSCMTLFAHGICIGAATDKEGNYVCEKFPRFLKSINMHYDLVNGRWVKSEENESSTAS